MTIALAVQTSAVSAGVLAFALPAITIPATANRLLTCTVSTATASGGATTVNAVIGGTSYPLTNYVTRANSGGAEIWYLIAPVAGSCVVTVNTSPATKLLAGVQCWTDVDQTTPFSGTGVTDLATGTAVSLPVTVSATQAALAVLQAQGLPTATTGQTANYNLVTSGGTTASNARGVAAYFIGSIAAMTFTISASVNWAAVAAVMNATSGAAVVSRRSRGVML